MLELLKITLGSFAGTLGFAVLLHAPRRAWLPSSIIGALGYMLFWGLMRLGLSEPSAMFVGVLVASMLAQLAARRMRMIATIFATLAIIPGVPGMGLYRCMSLLAQGMSAAGVREGVSAMTDIVMIALALGVGSFLTRRLMKRAEPPCAPRGE